MTELNSQNPKPDFSKIDESSEDSAIDNLQKKLNSLEDRRREERFYWICGLVLVFDVFAFGMMETWAGPIALTLIQIVVIVPLGRSLGVDSIWTLTERIISKWDGKFGS